MKIFKDKQSLQKEIFKNKGISLIPTMGALHEGHISLIKRSKKFKLKTLVTIFVNPKQFNKKVDFKNYPKNIKKDIKVLKKLNINYLYIPTFKDIYEFEPKRKVFLDKISKKLCGKYRKGHFEGVLNVMNRFLEIIKPKYIFMGMKDYQQLYLIKKHIEKRNIDSKIIECKTIREKNGVACSSRNLRLNSQQIDIASNIFHYLYGLKKRINKNYKVFNLNDVKKKIMELGARKVEYIENYNVKNFKKINSSKKRFNIFISYYLKNIRLIDNI